MGGLGSGQRWKKKRVVEQCSSIDTRDLKRWNLLVPGITNRIGSFEWRRVAGTSTVGYALTVGPSTGTLRLLYAMTTQNVECDYIVRLTTTPCRLGGVRWWFVCPLAENGVGCNRRVRKLYCCGRYFGCRTCHGLTYRSTQQSDSRVYAALRSGLHLDGFSNTEGMSVTKLEFVLKVLSAGQKRLNRICQRMDRIGRKRRSKEPEET